MKKTFPLHATDRDSARLIDAIKHDVRKYVKRERRKDVPAGADFWDFACKVGVDQATAETKRIDAVNPAIDAVALTEAAAVYVEILAVPGHHVRHPAAPTAPETPPAMPQHPPLATGREGSETHSLQDPA